MMEPNSHSLDAAKHTRPGIGAGTVPDLRYGSLHVLGEDGRLSWIIDAFTTSDSYPYSNLPSPQQQLHQLHAEQREGGDRRLRWYQTTFYVFDTEDPIIAAYRRIFPTLFKDVSTMLAGLEETCALPGNASNSRRKSTAYITTDPEAFYNREDLSGLWRPKLP